MLRIVRGARLDRLLDAMLAAMARAPLPPPTQEVVVIQGRGLDRWISQQAALRQGGWGFVETLFPRPFLIRAFAAMLDGAAPTAQVDQGVMGLELQLRVAALLPELIDDARFAGVAAAMRGNRAPVAEAALALAPRIAEVLDRCTQHRVDRVVAWSNGEELTDEHPDESWLAELWRRIAQSASPSRLVTDRKRFIEACEKGGATPRGLPQRVSIFGVSTLAPAFLELLEALGRRLEITVYALDPCPGPGVHPLVGAWGVESIEFAHMIGERAEEGGLALVSADGAPPPAERQGLLAMAQSRLRGDARDGASRTELDTKPTARDDTLSLHPCRGALREVEVAHDSIVSLLRGDPTLQPRDVAILTPDIEQYGPIVEAVFGARRDQRARAVLPFAVADRDRETMQAVEAFARVLELALSRCEREEMLETLALEPIGAAFEVGASGLEAIEQWCTLAGIRWGLDAEHRALHGRPGETIGTWQWGIDRLHLGAAVADGTAGALGTAEPVAPVFAVEGQGSAQVATLQSFIDAISLLARLGNGTRPLALKVVEGVCDVGGARSTRELDWLAVIDAVADRVLPRDAAHANGVAVVRGKLAAIRAAAIAGGFHGAAYAIGARAAVSFIIEQLREAHPGRGLLASGVTVAALQPMRSIPFRVIVLVGMADGAIPRAVSHASFDLVAARPRRGDRTARLDDRQVMLETLFAASRAVIITWPGIDPTSGLPLPASVLVDELLDVVPEARPSARGGDDDDAEIRRAPFATASTSVSTAVHANAGRTPTVLATTARTTTVLTLDELQRFWKSPAQAHLRAIGVHTEWDDRATAEEDPISNEFERALIRAMMPIDLEGERATFAVQQTAKAVLDGRGLLPRGPSGVRVMDSVREMLTGWSVDVEEIARGAGANEGLQASLTRIEIDIEVDVELDVGADAEVEIAGPTGAERSPASAQSSGRRAERATEVTRVRLTGSVPALIGVGPLIVTDQGDDDPRTLVRMWIQLLAARVAGTVPRRTDDQCHALLLARKAAGHGDEHAMKPSARLIEAPSIEVAREQLTTLVEFFVRGQREPIAFMPRSSLEYAHHCEKKNPEPESALEKTRSAFAGRHGDAKDADVRALFGPDRFLDAPSDADPCSFVALAERIARPLQRATKDGKTTDKLLKAAKLTATPSSHADSLGTANAPRKRRKSG